MLNEENGFTSDIMYVTNGTNNGVVALYTSANGETSAGCVSKDERSYLGMRWADQGTFLESYLNQSGGGLPIAAYGYKTGFKTQAPPGTIYEGCRVLPEFSVTPETVCPEGKCGAAYLPSGGASSTTVPGIPDCAPEDRVCNLDKTAPTCTSLWNPPNDGDGGAPDAGGACPPAQVCGSACCEPGHMCMTGICM